MQLVQLGLVYPYRTLKIIIIISPATNRTGLALEFSAARNQVKNDLLFSQLYLNLGNTKDEDPERDRTRIMDPGAQFITDSAESGSYLDIFVAFEKICCQYKGNHW